MRWDIAVGVVAGLIAVWLVLILALLIVKPDRGGLPGAVRLLPDLVRLIARLAKDPSLPRSVRTRVALLALYLASPIDLVPDFIPVVGYADDAILVILVLRAVVRRAGLDAVRGHWPGSDEGFALLCRLTGLAEPPSSQPPTTSGGGGGAAAGRSGQEHDESDRGDQHPHHQVSERGRGAERGPDQAGDTGRGEVAK